MPELKNKKGPATCQMSGEIDTVQKKERQPVSEEFFPGNKGEVNGTKIGRPKILGGGGHI